MASNITPTMISALNIIAKTGLTEGVRATTVKALVSRELIWDDRGAWYLTSEAHDLDGVEGDAREADMARQDARVDEAEDMTGHWAEQGADVDPEDAQVFQGAMHEATTPQAIGDTLRVLAESVHGVADALNTAGLAANAAAQKLATAAWSHQMAIVRSMGRTVRGKVIDASVRTPDASGLNRVLLVVQHDGHPTRRTLHALSDVKFEALTS